MVYDFIFFCIYLRYFYLNLIIFVCYCLLINRKEMYNLEFEICIGYECFLIFVQVMKVLYNFYCLLLIDFIMFYYVLI